MKVSKLFLLIAICASAVGLSQGRNISGIVDAGGNPEGKIVVSDVKDYRGMFRVNDKPIDMLEETKLLCAPPVLGHGPHYDPGVVYYINEIARRGLSQYADKKQFPVGSIIVKEKQEKKTEDSVQIITVMKKVSSTRDDGSWDYKMYDAKKWTEIDISQQASSRSSCIGCHRQYKNSDYVSHRGIELLLAK